MGLRLSSQGITVQDKGFELRFKLLAEIVIETIQIGLINQYLKDNKLSKWEMAQSELNILGSELRKRLKLK